MICVQHSAIARVRVLVLIPGPTRPSRCGNRQSAAAHVLVAYVFPRNNERPGCASAHPFGVASSSFECT